MRQKNPYPSFVRLYAGIARALAQLFDPLVEVVIHDLATGRICLIAGNLSQRKVGDLSLLDLDAKHDLKDIDQIVYPKLNFDGRPLQSISVSLKENRRGCVKALLCINCDVSLFHQMKRVSDTLLSHTASDQPQILFKNDWQEKLHTTIHKEVQQKNWNFSRLNYKQKKALVKHLLALGAFENKHAADTVAKVLSIGRSTVFKYLKQWRLAT